MKSRTFVAILLVLTALAASAGIVTASESAAKLPDGPVVVKDKFNDTAGTTLTSHTPDIDEVGGGWKVEFGPNFEIAPSGKEVRNTLGLKTPYFALIDGKLEDNDITVDFTRSGQSSRTGIVFRWKDSDNHYLGVFNGTKGRLIKKIGGLEFILDTGDAKWKDGHTKTMRVVANSGAIDLYLDNKKIASATDTELREETHIGLFYQNNSRTSIGDFTVRALGESTTVPTPALGSLVLEDDFDSGAGVLDGRPANNQSGANEWVDVVGTWGVTAGGKAKLTTSAGGDQIAAIPTGLSEPDISADVTWISGNAGLAWGVDASDDRSIVFFDGSYMVAGHIDATDGFLELRRSSYTWPSGETRNMRVKINGTNARIYVDDPSNPNDEKDILLLAIGHGMGTQMRAGFFTTATANLFDDFKVRNSIALLEPDPTVSPGTPQVLDPPAVPSGAYLFDSFTYYNSDQIQNRTPDLDPSGLGWQINSGKWVFSNFKIGELIEDDGDKFSFIDTGRDEYVISSEQVWDGGRTGITFGGLGPSNRNGFIYFIQSNGNVTLGKKIGGAYFGLGSQTVKWKKGARKTLSVEVQDNVLKAYVGKRRVFTVTDNDLPNSTWAGIFRNGFHDDRFDDFLLNLPAGAPTPTPTPTPVPIISDTFTGSDETLLSSRSPDIVPTASAWAKSTARGDWEILSNKATETGEFDYGQLDRRLVIDTGVSDYELSVDITQVGEQWTTHFNKTQNPASGVVVRSASDDSQWVMWYWDGVGHLVAFASTGELGRSSFTWTVGDTHTLGVHVKGDTLTFKLDGSSLFSRTHSTGNTNTHVGLFAVGMEEGKANTFDNFKIIPVP